MNKTVKMMIGITAGLALLLGPTAVYAGKGNDNKEKGRGDQKVKVESEREKTNKKSGNEDSFNEDNDRRRDTDSYNTECSGVNVNVIADNCSGGRNNGGGGGDGNGDGEGGDDGLLEDSELLNDLLEGGLLDCEIDEPNLTGAASVSVERQQDRTVVDAEAHPGEPAVDADCD